MQLQLGTAKLDITPEQPVPLAGFAIRKQLGRHTGVSHRLYARVFFFKSVEECGKEHVSLFVTADLIWWGSDRVPVLKENIHKSYGIPEANIILHATHTHSGPQTSGLFTSYLGEPVDVYIDFLERTLLEGIQQALDNVEEVSVERGNAECELSINRRWISHNKVQLHPNADGITDPELTVIRFRKQGGEPKAILAHYTCHPVVTDENLVSSDFTGVAMEQVEQSLGDHVICGYIQGFCGDINPGKAGEFNLGTNEQVMEHGCALANKIMSVLNRQLVSLQPCLLEIRNETVMLPVQEVPSREELLKLGNATGVMGEWSRLMLEAGEKQKLRREIPLEMTWIRLADGLALLTMNGEIVVEYGLWIKQSFAGQVLPVGYSNGMFGYVPTAKQLEEGGYEPLDSIRYFAMPAPFDPVIEAKIREAVLAIVE